MSWLSVFLKRNRPALDLLTDYGKEWLKMEIDSIDVQTVEEFKKVLKERVDKL